jgi:hypothetical protein
MMAYVGIAGKEFLVGLNVKRPVFAIAVMDLASGRLGKFGIGSIHQ